MPGAIQTMVGEIFAIGAAVAFAVNNVFLQRAMVPSVTPAVTTFVSNLVCMLMLGMGLLVMWLRDAIPVISWPAVALFALAGIFTTGLGRITEAMAIHHIGASRTASIRMLDPLFGYALAIAFLGDRFLWGPSIGIVIVLVGMQILSADQQNGHHPGSDQSSLLKGILIGVLCSLIYAIGNVLRKAGVEIMPSALIGSVSAMSVGLVMAAATVLRSPRHRESLKGLTLPSTINLAISAAGATAGQYFMFTALETTTVAVAATLRNTAPWFTMIMAALWLGARDKLTGRLALSTLLVMVGVALVINR